MRISQLKFNGEYFDSCRTTMTYPKSCLKIKPAKLVLNAKI